MSAHNTMGNLFIRVKPSRVLILLLDTNSIWYPSKIAKNARVSYVFVKMLLVNLQKSGMASIESSGNKSVIKLTDKGAKAARAIFELKKLTDYMEPSE